MITECDQKMVIEDTKFFFHSKAFQNVPKLGVWFENKPSGNHVSNEQTSLSEAE
jgi:hypothetical protein